MYLLVELLGMSMESKGEVSENPIFPFSGVVVVLQVSVHFYARASEIRKTAESIGVNCIHGFIHHENKRWQK